MSEIVDPDNKLISAAQNGDSQALEILLKNHYEKIWGICKRLMINDQDALDATQESLIAIATRINKFERRSKFSTWLYRVTTNICFDELRKKSRIPIPDSESGQLEISIDPSFENQIDDKLLINEVLNLLPNEFKTVLVLRDLCDLNYDEISEILNIPIGTVRSRISRGRSAISNYLTNGNQPDSSERQKGNYERF
ncbi:MAG: RNA polymerase sigma factor [Acidimicrobiales bacterium]|nr:RNA polymerase sigma factor [Acidimicrobiales bacterium]